MRSIAALTLVAACADPVAHEERALADMKISATVDVDVGVPQDPYDYPNPATGLQVLIDYFGDTCYTLRASASADVDGQPIALVDGSSGDHHDGSTFCNKPVLQLETVLPPRDRSTITLADDTATYSISVGRLFVNPRITMASSLAVGPVIARVEDPRAIASAEVWWRASTGHSWMKTVDVSTQGELRFSIPPGTSGDGTLGVSVTIRDNDVSCVGFTSCKAIVRGGSAFAVTIQ